MSDAESPLPGRPIWRGPVARTGRVQPYYRLVRGETEQHEVRRDLADGPLADDPRSLAHVAHLTDVQLLDVQSPSRLEAVHALGRRPETTLMLPLQRPQELLAAHATDALIRRLDAVEASPRTGAPLQLLLTTGDNVDNMQENEVTAFLRLLDGGVVDLRSGGPTYEGAQDGSRDWSWAPEHPDSVWGRDHGFPTVPGLISAALEPLTVGGTRLPWLSCFGNHDGLVQGRVPATPELVELTLGHRKAAVVRAEDAGAFTQDPGPAYADRSWSVTADPARRLMSRGEYVAAHFGRGRPHGHGFTEDNLARGTAYYAHDDLPGIRVVVLDTTNPAGIFEGSIDEGQLAWLRETLEEAAADERLVVVASHHPRGSMTNDRETWGEVAGEGRRVLGEEVDALLLSHPHVIAWVSGHIHRNRVSPRSTPEGSGYWEISTSSVMDWPAQSRLIEILDHGGGLLSLLLTMVDHDGPVAPSGVGSVDELAGWHRELAANDPFGVGGFEAHGTRADRNVELLLRDPRRA